MRPTTPLVLNSSKEMMHAAGSDRDVLPSFAGKKAHHPFNVAS